MISVMPTKGTVAAVPGPRPKDSRIEATSGGNRGSAVGSGEETDEGHPDLDGQEEAVGIPGQLRCTGAAAAPALDLPDPALVQRHQGHFRSGEQTSDEHEEHRNREVQQRFAVHGMNLLNAATSRAASVLSYRLRKAMPAAAAAHRTLAKVPRIKRSAAPDLPSSE